MCGFIRLARRVVYETAHSIRFSLLAAGRSSPDFCSLDVLANKLGVAAAVRAENIVGRFGKFYQLGAREQPPVTCPLDVVDEHAVSTPHY